MYYSSDKVYIYIPSEYISRIDNDAKNFEVFNEDGQTINRNGFLSMLICGYCTQYLEEERVAKSHILEALENTSIKEDSKSELANSLLMTMYVTKTEHKSKRQRLSLRINRMNRYYVEAIINSSDDSESISQNFCRLITSYFEKPIYERERIIFNDYYHRLIDACQNKGAISIKTKNKRSPYHKVIPYKVCLGKEERYNYLLCAEIDRGTGEQFAMSYRLNRLRGSIISDPSISVIEKSVVKHLDLMEEYGAQFRINEDIETCVRFTENGIQKFIKIYWGRPIPTKHKIDENGDVCYYFNCSQNQLELYFNRFGDGAEILYPESLRQNIISFHTKSLMVYDGH